MTQTDREVVSSLKSLYSEKWREGLLVHILIGLGRSIMRQSQASSKLCEETVTCIDSPEEAEEVIRALHENPIGYVRLINEKLANELENQIRTIRRGPMKQDTQCTLPEFGELLEAIGVQAKLRLEGGDKEELAGLLEAVIQASWDEAPLALREDALRIIRLISFFSGSITGEEPRS